MASLLCYTFPPKGMVAVTLDQLPTSLLLNRSGTESLGNPREIPKVIAIPGDLFLASQGIARTFHYPLTSNKNET